LVGRSFVDDADLEAQCGQWQTRVNTERVSQATDVTPLARLVEESARGGTLPITAGDYGLAEPGKVSRGAVVPVLRNNYSVPVEHVGAPVTVRVHRQRIVIWRDAELLAEHRRAPDGTHRRVVSCSDLKAQSASSNCSGPSSTPAARSASRPSHHNAPDSSGVGPIPLNVRDGVRVSTAVAYLLPARRRPRWGETLVSGTRQ
jgi:hypothetical protein